jgi:cation:H+ antiporter
MMAGAPSRRVDGPAWRRHLIAAAGVAALGVAVHLAAPYLPMPLVMVGLGSGLIGASFMLAWAADAGETVYSGGLVLAAVALVAVLPEFVIEIRFAFIQQAELVTANLTGATRLLLTGAAALPLLVYLFARRRGQEAAPVRLADNRRLELGILLVTAVLAVSLVARGQLTVVDGSVLVALYILYARRVQGTPDEEPAVVGVAAGLLSVPPLYRRFLITGLIVVAGGVVLVIANPFADALLETGSAFGIDPYLLIQSVVPAATEAPELVIVAVLVVNHRPAQGLALFLASAVSQWTLGLGLLPIAYLAGGGGMSMPLAAREQLELGLTIAVTLFVVAALATLRLERADAFLIAGIFMLQIVFPTPFVRLTATLVLLVFAIDLLCAHRRSLPSILRAGFGRRRRSANPVSRP